MRFFGTTRTARWSFRLPHAGESVGKSYGTLAEGTRKKITYQDTVLQPRSVITSPMVWARARWSLSSLSCRTSSAVPWHTLTGRPRRSQSTTTG